MKLVKLAKRIEHEHYGKNLVFFCVVKISKYLQTVKPFFFFKTFLFKLKNKFDKHIKRPQTDQQDKRCKRRNKIWKRLHWTVTDSITDP